MTVQELIFLGLCNKGVRPDLALDAIEQAMNAPKFAGFINLWNEDATILSSLKGAILLEAVQLFIKTPPATNPTMPISHASKPIERIS